MKLIKTGIKLLSILGFVFFLSACDDNPPVPKEFKPSIVQKAIIPPDSPAKPEKGLSTGVEKKIQIPDKPDKADQPVTIQPEKVNQSDEVNQPQIPSEKEVVNPELPEKNPGAVAPDGMAKKDHYDSQGKIDPFKPLIQDKPEETVVANDNKPKRILTPLEKIDLSQIRLVAVILMKNKKIAMVEESSGKGYEVGIGTFIGKNQGRVSEILSSSIVVKELVKDFRGQLKEQTQEIKLNKISDEE